MNNPADHLAVIQLLSRYAFTLDEVDPDGVANCFTEDGKWFSAFHGALVGREAIRELNQRRKDKLDAAPPTYRRHYIINPLVELDGDRGTVRAYMLGTLIEDEKIKVALTGHYRAEIVKEADGEWRFTERHAIPDSTETGWG